MGCTDHGCVFGHPGGMGTNGGCRCLDDLRYGKATPLRVSKLRREIVAAREAAYRRGMEAARDAITFAPWIGTSGSMEPVRITGKGYALEIIRALLTEKGE